MQGRKEGKIVIAVMPERNFKKFSPSYFVLYTPHQNANSNITKGVSLFIHEELN